MTSGQSEVVLGEFPAVARLAIGVERIKLIVTNTRIVVAHVGKRGAGETSAAAFLGGLSSGLEDLLKSGKESVSQRGSRGFSPDRVLALDKDNFAIRHDEVVRITVEEWPRTTGITILTGHEKLEFTSLLRFEPVLQLLQGPLGGKLFASRMPK